MDNSQLMELSRCPTIHDPRILELESWETYRFFQAPLPSRFTNVESKVQKSVFLLQFFVCLAGWLEKMIKFTPGRTSVLGKSFSGSLYLPVIYSYLDSFHENNLWICVFNLKSGRILQSFRVWPLRLDSLCRAGRQAESQLPLPT